ncbi:MAG: hypothetical protein HC933_19360 [Pleurocapsa sp. SU_196_0]|nr:hypothetical protein [Pleurocapsa sp. SU_196_0]
MMITPEITAFIVKAKTNTWNDNRQASLSYRPGSRDLQYHEADLSYMDSYFGNVDFLGQEVVWRKNLPIWTMNYYGRILRPDLYSGAQAGTTSQIGRGQIYKWNTFLGKYMFVLEHSTFFTETKGDVSSFSGSEWHEINGVVVYRFDFHGGQVLFD